MDAVTGYGGARPGAGGKIVRQRRNIAARKPYDRPILRSRDPPQQNPSWISRLVYKPASVIASGAGKFISSVVFSESSSSSSSDTDSASDIDDDEDVEKNVTDFTEDETMEENPLNAEQPTFQMTSTKHVIEQLLMQETFTRDECDRLIDKIKTRVVDDLSTPADEGRDIGLTSDGNLPEMSTKAVMEARKWLEEKKSGSSLKYNPSSGNSPFNSFALPQATEDGAGSPVDLAKSYMRTTRPWASPAVNNSDFLSLSPTGMQFPKEGTPFSYSAGNFSSSKLKRGSHSKQSWNIHEEIRKVRAKATEEMLKSGSPGSVTSLEQYRNPYVLATDIFKRNSREMFLPCSNPVDASLNADEGVQAVRNLQSEPQVNVLQNSTIPTSEQNQTMKANQATEETGALHSRFRGEDASDETFMSTQGVKPSEDMNTAPQSGADADDFDDQDGPSSPIINTTHAVLALGATVNSPGNLCVPKDVFETSNDAHETGAEHPTSNGFPSSTPSSPVAIQSQPESNPPVEENHRLSSSQDEPNANLDIPNSHQPLTDPPTDIPVRNGSETALTNENNSASSGSHNSSSSREEEWRPEEHSLPNSNSASSSPVYTKARSVGRGRGRGRGRARGRGKGRAK